MDNLRAAILRPQLAELDGNIERWNERYRTLESALRRSTLVHLPIRPDAEHYVGSSIQFLVEGISQQNARDFVLANKALGVELKWFGASEPVAFTSNHHSWRYLQQQNLPETDAVQCGLFDMRIPLTFTVADCAHIADIIVHCAGPLRLKGAA
jgi:dTDP-4-amino-4,6-dideoxygalactose transaminase